MPQIHSTQTEYPGVPDFDTIKLIQHKKDMGIECLCDIESNIPLNGKGAVLYSSILLDKYRLARFSIIMAVHPICHFGT